jgi:UDP-N-acetylglucosamine--N-acetylmuramyl-(pentapeptide) pyrophosphoryl-undecaprenol N-acetylglucosamine transferase
MRIMFVGGGTGGHFYPLIAVAEVLERYPKKPDLYYMGPSPYDLEALRKHGITFISCPAGKLRLYPSIQNFFDLFRNFFGIFVAVYKLFIIYPDVIFSKGGYTSVPVLLAARFLRIPVVIHESDSVPGRANNLAKKFARYIAISYDDAVQYFDKNKTALTGIPIRASLKNSSTDPFTEIGIPNDLPLIYVTGGSSGAERLNNLIISCLAELLPRYRVFHQVGKGKQEEIVLTTKSLIQDTNLQGHYYVQEIMPPEMVNSILNAASLIITRAGSTTLFEIAIHGKPSIVIPIPEDISRDQRSNAYAYARSGAAAVLEEHNLTKALLLAEIEAIIGNREQWQKMSAAAASFTTVDAADKIADILVSIGKEHGS